MKTEQIKKFLAWMELYGDGNDTYPLENTQTKNDERCVEAYIPLLERTINGVHKNPEIAFDLFFENFSEAVDEYLKDKPEIAKEFADYIQKVDEQNRKELQEKMRNRKESFEAKNLELDIRANKFNNDLDESIRMLENATRDISLVLDDDQSRLYLKVLPREYFPLKATNEQMYMKMHALCSSEVKESGCILLFTKCVVTDSSVLAIGVLERM